MIFDYETLKLIWWLFVAVLIIGFAVTDGFDLGIGTLLPFIGKDDYERRVVVNAIAPTWEGNQVWFITAGGALFAAWPLAYAAAFSGFYIALLLALYALFFRPVGFKYRSLIQDLRWRYAWDWALFAGAVVPAFIFGAAFGNLLQGVPFHFDRDLRVFYTGSFFAQLNPFGLFCGLLSVALLVMHGAHYLQIKTAGAIYERARRAGWIAAVLMMALFAAGGFWITYGVEGYRIVSMPPLDAVPNPTAKVVEKATGAWLDNYQRYPWTMLAPALGFAGAAMAMLFAAVNRSGIAFVASSASVTGVILTAGLSMFPFVMPSSSDPNSSLTAWDVTSSHKTLEIMFWAVVLFLPLIVAYTGWVYRVLGGKVTVEKIKSEEHTSY
ncbi:MAG: cytochrome d ubiquinol oxidase subunit II [Burkholderiales bacterium]|nr:MAG: cytochrome d ubiquinol oxidase subunit II [Burkholderiales bacterium]